MNEATEQSTRMEKLDTRRRVQVLLESVYSPVDLTEVCTEAYARRPGLSKNTSPFEQNGESGPTSSLTNQFTPPLLQQRLDSWRGDSKSSTSLSLVMFKVRSPASS